MSTPTPKLTLDFTSASLDPRVSFTRALATATRFNSSGLLEVVAADAPRFDFDPVTLACRGLLVENSSQNLFINSEDFTTWSAVTTNRTLAAGISPSGLNNANKLAPTSGASAPNSYILKNVTKAASALPYTMSIFAKAAEYTQVVVLMHGLSSGNNAQTRVTLTDGSNTNPSVAGNFTAPSVQVRNAGGGWWRIELTATTNTDTIVTGRIYPTLIGGTGDGTSGILAWGAQLEAGAFATSYIPTTTTALTRNADVAVMTGTNFSDWWQSSKGGVLVRARPGTVSGVRPWLQFDDGTANEIIALRVNTTNPELYIVDGGTPQAQIDAGTIAANTDYSLTGWWATNDCKARLDSGAVVTDTSATIPTVTQARLGSDGTNYLNGHLASISYYDSFSEQIYTRRKNKAVFSLL